VCETRILHAIDFRRLDLGDKETEFYWIARAGVPCCDIVQHRDRHRIAGAIVNEPADVWIMIDVFERDGMAMLRQHSLETAPEEVHGSASLGEDEWIVG